MNNKLGLALAIGLIFAVVPAVVQAESGSNSEAIVAAAGPHVTVTTSDGKTHPIAINKPLHNGDIINVPKGETVTLTLPNGSEWTVQPGSQVLIDTANGGSLIVIDGSISGPNGLNVATGGALDESSMSIVLSGSLTGEQTLALNNSATYQLAGFNPNEGGNPGFVGITPPTTGTLNPANTQGGSTGSTGSTGTTGTTGATNPANTGGGTTSANGAI